MGGHRRTKRPANPAQTPTQPVKVAPMGEGMGYGEGIEAQQAQQAMGIADKRTTAVRGPGGPVAVAGPGPPADALDAARGYTPNVMALNAVDDAPMVDVMRGAQRRSGRPDAIAEQRRNAAAIEVWEGLMEVNTEDPDIEFALDRMRVRARKFV